MDWNSVLLSDPVKSFHRHTRLKFLSLILIALFVGCAPVKENTDKSQVGKLGRGALTNPSYSQGAGYQTVSLVSPGPQTAPAKLTSGRDVELFGLKIPISRIPTLSEIAKSLQGADKPIDQAPAKQLAFPVVDDDEPMSEPQKNPTDSPDSVLDERSLLLLAEADRIYQNRSSASFSNGSQSNQVVMALENRFPQGSSHITASDAESSAMSKPLILSVLGLCMMILLTCAYFVVSYLFDEMRLRKSRKFGSRW